MDRKRPPRPAVSLPRTGYAVIRHDRSMAAGAIAGLPGYLVGNQALPQRAGYLPARNRAAQRAGSLGRSGTNPDILLAAGVENRPIIVKRKAGYKPSRHEKIRTLCLDPQGDSAEAIR